MFRVLIYLIFAALFTGGTYYKLAILDVPGFVVHGIRMLQFLTVINLVVDTVYAWLCVARSAVDYQQERSEMKRVGGRRYRTLSNQSSYYHDSPLHTTVDWLYATIFVPMGFSVVALFWGLYSMDEEFVLPRSVRPFYPDWLNHVAHTAPLVFILIDTMLHCHVYPAQRGWLPMLIFTFFYQINMVATRFLSGFWLYPVFDVLPMPGIVAFFLASYLASAGAYFAGDFLNRATWGRPSHPEEKDE